MAEVRAQLKNLRMSPKKVRLVTDLIKGLPADEALVRLDFSPKSASGAIKKLLKSAIANAKHNNELPEEALIVKSVVVNQAKPLKRWKPAAFGATHAYKKHASHVDLILALKPGVTVAKKKKEEKKKEDKKEDIKQVTAKEARKMAHAKAPGGKLEAGEKSAPKAAEEHRAAQQVRKSQHGQ